tara:strand:+ start:89 stop:397 length:309 start_codon:yes stop_codon:yes gene_type:complete
MDNRLDFYNYLKSHKQTLEEEDVLLVVAYNTKDKDCVIQTHGMLDKLTPILKKNGLANVNQNIFRSKFNLVTFILESALEICVDDEEVADLMINELIKKLDK